MVAALWLADILDRLLLEKTISLKASRTSRLIRVILFMLPAGLPVRLIFGSLNSNGIVFFYLRIVIYYISSLSYLFASAASFSFQDLQSTFRKLLCR